MTLAEFFTNLSTLSILLFIFGILLLVIEMMNPGFGVAGGLGIVCMIADVIVTAESWRQALILTVVFLVIIAAFLVACIVLAQKGKLSGKLILKQSTDTSSGFSASEFSSADEKQALLGLTGTAVTVLRPAGVADFGRVRTDVVTQGDYINKGSALEVISVEGNRIIVRPAEVPAGVS